MAYQKVLSEATIPGFVRKESAWKIISDYSQYPAIMDNVDKVEILERNGSEGLSKWYVSVEEAPLYWMEKDHFSRRDYHIQFKSIEGDFDNINGQWRITDSRESGIKISFEIEYNLGIPVIEEVLGDILREKMKSNMEKMMGAIKKEITSRATEERRFPRAAINKRHTGRQNGAEQDLIVINLSAGGIMVRKPLQPIKAGTLRLADAILDIASVFNDETGDHCRIVFRKPLEDEVLCSIRESLISGGRAAAAPRAIVQDAILFDSKEELPIQLLELTSQGMCLYSPGAKLPDFSVLSPDPAGFPFKEIIRDEKTNTVRVIFSMPLSSEQHRLVADHFKAV